MVSTINMGTLHRVSNKFKSLSEGTNLEVTLETEGYNFVGLNSPYVTHQQMNFTKGHGKIHLIVLKKATFTVALTEYDSFDNWKFAAVIDIPKKLAENTLARLTNLGVVFPDWLKDTKDIAVAISNNFSGYDEHGSPKYSTEESSIEYEGFKIVLKPEIEVN